MSLFNSPFVVETTHHVIPCDSVEFDSVKEEQVELGQLNLLL